MKKKTIGLCLMVYLIFIFAAACAAPSQSGKTDTDIGNNEEDVGNVSNSAKAEMVLSESEYAHFVGRVYGDDQSGYTISNTASGIEFATDSRNVYITLSGSQAPEGNAYVNVLIDNERVKRMEIGSQKKEYSLYVNRDQKVHTVKVLKATEAQYSSLVLHAVRGDGYFYPVTEKSQRKIAFYGDSITCGYGNIGDSSVKMYRTQDQDGTQTYAYFCADKLHAEIDVLAATAWSVNKSKWSSTTRIPDVFDCYSPINTRKYLSEPDERTDFVVVNLGTNDATYYTQASSADKKLNFEDPYYEFYKKLRGKYPNAKIILALGMMGQNSGAKVLELLEENVQNVVRRAQFDGDDNISYCRLYTASKPSDMGANGHPSVAAHKKAGEQLYAHINAKHAIELA